jgi:fructose-1,6-bisphosphatase I
MTLEEYLRTWEGAATGAERELRVAVGQTITALMQGAPELGDLLSQGPLAGQMSALVGEHADGDTQKELDLRAHDMFVAALREAPVAAVGSEEADEVVYLRRDQPLAVAMDPLDGSSNIDTNLSVGTLFSILPMDKAPSPTGDGPFLQPGTHQLAAGFVIFGPQTALVLSVGEGTQIFIEDRRTGTFHLGYENIRVKSGNPEYAINASNYRHWDDSIRTYVNDCLSGAEGPRGLNFNMRWVASMVADAYRIFMRGGVYLYPADNRKGYGKGRLRLVYEANPIGMLMEQAGGLATDCENRILEIVPTSLHQRTPLVFGTAEKVEMIRRYHQELNALGDRSPLFRRRSLFHP